MTECQGILEKIVMSPHLENLRLLATEAVRKVFMVNAKDLVWGDGTPDIKEDCREFRKILAELDLCNAPEDDGELYEKIMKPLFFLGVSKAK